LLVVAVLGLASTWVWPRARAAWDIHALGSSLADYALCMAGPTGPEELRDDTAAFRKLLRRRLVAAAPSDAPFARCAKAARDITSSPRIEDLHRAVAARFVEYGSADSGSPLSVTSLGIDSELLIERARSAWPFTRGSAARLVRPSLGAREAVHPVPPPEPVQGRGLPALRGLPKNSWHTADGYWVGIGNAAGQSLFVSVDNGQNFRAVRAAPGAEERLGRCVGRDPKRAFTLTSAEDGSLLVSSSDDTQSAVNQVAVRGEHHLLAVACDDSALVAAGRSEKQTAATLVLCPFGRPCTPLAAPAFAPFAPLLVENVDLARIGGITVMSVESHGVVRVASSRDDGATWAPPSVAFDAVEQPAFAADGRPPFQLLTLGSRLLLYGASKRPGGYALLVSDDQGASFRGVQVPTPRSVAVAR
jgi:hypothetical protein